MKKCAFIIPYFGSLPNFFPLFLRTLSYNQSYDLILVTDIDVKEKYNCPQNLKVVPMKFSELQERVKQLFGEKSVLPVPYKINDYAPMFGVIFAELLTEYDYWGYCDCDVLLGDLNDFLPSVLEKDFDKTFAAGHMTLFKNTAENNIRYSQSVRGEDPWYQEIIQTEKVMNFDEDYREKNIHTIFKETGAKVFAEDLAMNVYWGSVKFVRAKYNPQTADFDVLPYKKARYYWQDGKVFSWHNGADGNLVRQDYSYIHLQSRKMRMSQDCLTAPVVEILPGRFVPLDGLPKGNKISEKFLLPYVLQNWFDRKYKGLKRRLGIK